jgi:hypothetical protein
MSRQRRGLKLKLCLPITPPPTEVADEFVPRTYADRQTPSSSGLRSADLHLDIRREFTKIEDHQSSKRRLDVMD